MTDTTHEAHERIFTTGNSTTGSWNSKKATFKGPRETEYVLKSHSDDLVQAAVAAERERCAALAETRKGIGWNIDPCPYDTGYNVACDDIAAAIREGEK